MRNLDLALIGNGRIGALLADDGTIVWAAFQLRRRSQVLRLLNETGCNGERPVVDRRSTACAATVVRHQYRGADDAAHRPPGGAVRSRIARVHRSSTGALSTMTIVALRCVAGKPR